MSKVRAVPEGLRTVTAQLTVGNATEALEFLKKTFGAEVRSKAMDQSNKKVMHSEVRIGDSVIFVNDAFPELGGDPPSPSSLWIYSEDPDGLFKKALAAGATQTMAMADQFWGDRTGQVKDRWGNKWNVAKHVKDLTPEEMQKAQDAAMAQMKK